MPLQPVELPAPQLLAPPRLVQQDLRPLQRPQQLGLGSAPPVQPVLAELVLQLAQPVHLVHLERRWHLGQA